MISACLFSTDNKYVINVLCICMPCTALIILKTKCSNKDNIHLLTFTERTAAGCLPGRLIDFQMT